MAWTATHAGTLKRQSGVPATGAKTQKPVFAFSLAWHPEERPEQWEMVSAGRSALFTLGLEEHETLMVAHRDEDHPHLHLIVNTVHPSTGRTNTLPYSKRTLSTWAEQYERERGKIYCQQRVENNERRAKGEFVRYEEPEVDLKAEITRIYHSADSGKAFAAALAERGYTLAQGKRIVLIDRDGKTHSLSRQIEGVTAKNVRAKLANLKLRPVADLVNSGEEHGRKRLGHSPAPVNSSRDQHDPKGREQIIDAGVANAARPTLSQRLNQLQNRQLAELGHFYAKNQQARERLDFTLENQYGVSERQLRRDVLEIEGALKNPGVVRRWWLTLTGQRARAVRGLDEMRRSLQNIEQRKAEARAALAKDVEVRRRAIDARQRREKTGTEIVGLGNAREPGSRRDWRVEQKAVGGRELNTRLRDVETFRRRSRERDPGDRDRDP
jgi:hypothetical protein